MPDASLLLLASDSRARSEEVLARAETFNHADARQKLRKIAETYVKLAERLEQRARDEDKVYVRRRDFGVADQETAIRWLIALLVLWCDPLAIALTAAAAS
jgi:hypothetical protein